MKKKFSGSAPSEQQLPQFRLNFDPVFHGQDRQVIGYEARITGIEGEPLESIVTALNPLFLSSLFVKIGYEAMQSAAALGICGLQANLFIPLHARLKPENLNLAFLKKTAIDVGLDPARVLLGVFTTQAQVLGEQIFASVAAEYPSRSAA
jgi:hypothetical protein